MTIRLSGTVHTFWEYVLSTGRVHVQKRRKQADNKKTTDEVSTSENGIPEKS